jgi:hypothetical protein
MIRMIEGPVGRHPATYSTNCPFCCASLKFSVVSPVLCPKCGEELPEFDLLDETIGNRLQYYYDVRED